MKERIQGKTQARAHLSLPYETWVQVKEYCRINKIHLNKFVNDALKSKLLTTQLRSGK